MNPINKKYCYMWVYVTLDLTLGDPYSNSLTPEKIWQVVRTLNEVVIKWSKIYNSHGISSMRGPKSICGPCFFDLICRITKIKFFCRVLIKIIISGSADKISFAPWIF